MPIVDGEKYACASCIKGHRVSGCTHHDRELHHINPKGRPVKQCEHCRGARKSKSHHARCECGDKKDKGSSKEGSHCGCHHGKQCTCGSKKDSPNLMLETGSSKHAQAKAKPRLTGTHSESTLTVFANGHHKPCHRLNNSAHTSGVPYKIPRPHSLHGSIPQHQPHENTGNGYNGLHAPQRSVDNLPLLGQMYNPFGNGQRSVDSLPLTPTTGGLDLDIGNYGQQKFFFTKPSNTIGSANSSPTETSLNDPLGNSQWPSYLNTSVAPVSQFGLDGLSASPTVDYFTNPESSDLAIPSAGLNDPLWSAEDLPLDTNKLSNSFTQPISHSGESNRHSVPGLTTSSSGAQSEIGDHGLFGDLDYNKPPSNASEQLFFDQRQFRDLQAYRMGAAMKPEEMRPPTSMPVSDGRRSMDFDFLQRPASGLFEEAPKQMETAESLQNLPTYANNDVTLFGNTGSNQWVSLLGDDTFDMPLPQLDNGLDISPFSYNS